MPKSKLFRYKHKRIGSRMYDVGYVSAINKKIALMRIEKIWRKDFIKSSLREKK